MRHTTKQLYFAIFMRFHGLKSTHLDKIIIKKNIQHFFHWVKRSLWMLNKNSTIHFGTVYLLKCICVKINWTLFNSAMESSGESILGNNIMRSLNFTAANPTRKLRIYNTLVLIPAFDPIDILYAKVWMDVRDLSFLRFNYYFKWFFLSISFLLVTERTSLAKFFGFFFKFHQYSR